MASSLERLQQTHDVEIAWHAFELRPPGAPPMPPEYRARIEAGQPRLKAMAREQYGLELNPGPFGISSRAALIGEQYAIAQGVGHAYHDAVADAYWRDGKSIDDPKLLADLAEAAGLERVGFLAALNDPAYIAAVEEDAAWAHAHGLSGVPAAVFAQKYLVSGAQPYALFEQVVERCEAER